MKRGKFSKDFPVSVIFLSKAVRQFHQFIHSIPMYDKSMTIQ